MAITTRSYTVTIGTAQALEVAQGEDRRFIFTFKEPGTSTGKDMSGLTAAVLTVKDSSDTLLWARSYTSSASTPASGILAFDILQADTASESVAAYNVDVSWTDSGGLKEQLLVKSRFLILKGVGASGDSVTTPPAIPVVYGLRWRDGWSSPSGGYLINDAVYANDGSLGASAQGITCISTFRCIASGTTYYPISDLLLPATGWQYVGQHGGIGATGPQGPGPGQTVTGQKTANYSAVAGDFVRCNPTGGTFVVFLPAPTGAVTDPPITVKHQSDSNNTVLIHVASGFTIDGSSMTSIDVARGALLFKADGTSDWLVY